MAPTQLNIDDLRLFLETCKACRASLDAAASTFQTAINNVAASWQDNVFLAAKDVTDEAAKKLGSTMESMENDIINKVDALERWAREYGALINKF